MAPLTQIFGSAPDFGIMLRMIWKLRSVRRRLQVQTSLFSLLCWLSSWRCPHLLLSAVLRRRCCWAVWRLLHGACNMPIAVNLYFMPAAATAAVDHCDRKMDACTLYIDPVLLTVWAASKRWRKKIHCEGNHLTQVCPENCCYTRVCESLDAVNVYLIFLVILVCYRLTYLCFTSICIYECFPLYFVFSVTIKWPQC